MLNNKDKSFWEIVDESNKDNLTLSKKKVTKNSKKLITN